MAFADHIEAVDRAALTHLGGVSVTYTPTIGQPVTVQGMFDELVQDPATGLLGPAVFLRLEDLPVHPDEEPDTSVTPLFTIAGKNYRVRGRIEDGFGGVHISLVAAV